MSDLQDFADEAHRLQIEHYTGVARYMEAKAAAEAAAAECNLTTAQLEMKTAELMHLRMQNANRPSIVLQAQIKQRDYDFAAGYGGVTAYGSTPEIAFQNFDRLWSQGHE